MDARGWNGPPDAQDDANEHDGHVRPVASVRLHYAIGGLLSAVADAANPHYPEYAPYRGNVTQVAIFYAKHVMRELRKAGLYPTTAELAAEVERRAAA